MPKAVEFACSRRTRAALAALALGLVSAPLVGEDFFRLKEQISQRAWLRGGPLHLESSFVLRNLGYSTNIYQLAANKKPDWVSDASLALTVSAFVGRRLILQLRDTPHYNHFAWNQQERAWGNDLEAGACSYLGRFNLSARSGRHRLFVQPTLETGFFMRETGTRGSAAVDYGRRDRFTVGLQLDWRRLEYERRVRGYDITDSSRLLSREEWSAGLSVNRRVFTRTFLSFSGLYFRHRFPHYPVRDRDGGEFSIALRLPEIGRVQGTLAGGLRLYRPLSALFHRYARPFGSGLVTATLLGRLRLRGHYRIDNNYSIYGPDYYFDVRALGAGAEVAVTRRLRLAGDVTAERRDYRFLGRRELVRRDDVRTVRLDLVLTLSSRLAMGVSGTASFSDCSQPTYQQDFSRAGLFLRVDF